MSETIEGDIEQLVKEKYRWELLDEVEREELLRFHKALSYSSLFTLAISGLFYVSAGAVLALRSHDFESAAVSLLSFWLTSAVTGLSVMLIGLAVDMGVTFAGSTLGVSYESNRKIDERPGCVALLSAAGDGVRNTGPQIVLFPPLGVMSSIRSLMVTARLVHIICSPDKDLC